MSQSSSSTLFKRLYPSETIGPTKVKFHVELLWDGGTQVCSNGLSHMIKMAAMPIYGKNLKNLLLWNQKVNDLENRYASSSAQVLPSLLKWWPWVDLDQFLGKVKFGPLCFCMEKRKNNGFFRNYCHLWFETTNRWQKWQEVSVDIKTFILWGLYAPCPRAKYMYQIMKKIV